MSVSQTQIFQTASDTRWKRFKWSIRLLCFVAIFFIAVLLLALYRGFTPSLPNLEERSRVYRNKLDPTNPLTFAHSQNKKINGFKAFLAHQDSSENKQPPNEAATKLPFMRAVFYTPWTAKTALPELNQYGDRINAIFPEWYFIDSNGHRPEARIDSAGYALMQQKKLRILPMLSNFHSGKKDFDGGLVHDILTNAPKRSLFIQQLADSFSAHHFQGVNVDFEELNETSPAPLTQFMKDLYASFHKRGMWVTIDVPPFNNDYDLKNLAPFCDFIILMAYDQYSQTSTAGPISAQKWVEDAMDWAGNRIEPDKIILGLAAYGYDWTKGKKEASVYTYNDAINKAKLVKANIDYDNNSYNLHYQYSMEETNEEGEKSIQDHDVWFTDAATIFNMLRFNDAYGTAGTALWRLGGEDSRIWNFYNRNLSNESLQQHPFDYHSLERIPIIPNSVQLVGQGELLNILYKPQEGRLKLEIDSTEQLISEQQYETLPSGYVIQKFAEDSTEGKGHKLILTFDDGPSELYTPQILDILEKEKVPASFFVVGLQAEQNIPLLQRIHADGFEIGNHTFTHNNIAQMSPKRAAVEMKLTRLLIECITGRSTILFRAPYNADSEPQTFEELEPIARSREENYLTVGESIDPNDWEPHITADTIFQRVVKQVQERNASIILLHDAGGETRQATVEALPKIIHYFKNKGYRFTTIADLMHKTSADVMPAIPASRDSWLISLNFFLAEATYWGSHLIYSLFLIGIFLSIGRIVVMAWLAGRQLQKQRPQTLTEFPGVSIIVPAYNEEVNAVRTVESLLNQDYPNFDIIFVDDGSKDNTFAVVKKAFTGNRQVTVVSKPNGGKSSALNEGIRLAQHPFVVCIDADSQLKYDAVTELMKGFIADEKEQRPVAAVAGHVKVGNEINLITRWQSIEYTTSQNFDRRAFDLINAITVVPGAIGAFRKDALLDAGGFATDTLAEDCDLTMRLQRNGYRIRNCSSAISYTEAPETLKQFLKQRFRWSFGVMQCFWKHRDAVFNPRYKAFGMVALPNILLYQILLPFLAPLADLILVFSLLSAAMGVIPASLSHIINYYLIFTVVDMAGASLAFAFENRGLPAHNREPYSKLGWMLPQRLVYRQLMYYILFKSFSRALKGELQGWGVLKRTGNVQAQPLAQI